jgi:acyl-CoA dehydrogenase
VHINLFGPHPIVVFGTPEQKAALGAAAGGGAGQVLPSASPSPTPGSTPPHIKTFAKKVDGGYLVNGQKVWTSTGAGGRARSCC